MYLFSRSAQLAPGNTRAAMAWATGITEKVNQITALNVTLFTQMFSPDVGTLAWSALVPDLATLEAATDKLAVDDAYVSMVDSGAKFSAGGAVDALLQVVSGEPDPNRPFEYVTTIQTVCATGAVSKGIELGIEIAQRAEKIIGMPVMFTTSATGTYGAVEWLTAYTDVKTFESAQQALAADTKFAEFIDKSVKGVYSDDPNQSRQLIWRRII